MCVKYEGKSVAALIAMVQCGEIDRNSRILYVHLGGSPAIHAYDKAFETDYT
jgi:1-aminocyclopropane-1-carboxylate deaminase